MLTGSDSRAHLVLADAVIAAAAFVLSLRFRFGPGFVAVWEQTLGLPPIAVFTPLLAGSVVAVFWVVGVYRKETYWTFRSEALDLIRGLALAGLIVLSLLFWFRLEDVSRKTLAGFFGGLGAGALFLRLLLRQLRSDGAERVRALVVGDSDAERFLRVPGLQVVGGLGVPSGSPIADLGAVSDLPERLAEEVVDEVIVCLPPERWDLLDSIVSVCQEQGKTVRVPVDILRYLLRQSRVEDLGGVPVLSAVTTPGNHLALVAKRLIDVAGATLALLLALPIGLVVVPMLLTGQGRPLFFKQVRGGINGRPFTVFKFRTMRNGADGEKPQLAGLNERVGPAFKVTNDPRVTRVGRWLRKSSFDEVPQFWNVLRGDMSLVGPRPQPIEEVRAYDAWHRRRLSVKPGITGLWQVTSRHDPSFDKWVDLDLDYIDRWSLWMDLKILARTPMAVVRSPGE